MAIAVAGGDERKEEAAVVGRGKAKL